jgi:hypothetical protein
MLKKQYHKNPRQITDKQFAELKTSLEELGDLSGIVFNTSSGEILSGNQRSQVFDINECEVTYTEKFDKADEQGTLALGYVIWRGNKFAYREVSWDEKTSERAVVVANKLGGDWDKEILANQFEINDLQDWGFSETDLTGFEYGGVDDIDRVDSFSESVNFSIKCKNLTELGELQSKLSVETQKINYSDFIQKTGI